jgi:hypothetical protein
MVGRLAFVFCGGVVSLIGWMLVRAARLRTISK